VTAHKTTDKSASN